MDIYIYNMVFKIMSPINYAINTIIFPYSSQIYRGLQK